MQVITDCAHADVTPDTVHRILYSVLHEADTVYEWLSGILFLTMQ